MALPLGQVPAAMERCRATRTVVEFKSRPGEGKNGVQVAYCMAQNYGCVIRTIPNINHSDVVGFAVPQKNEDGEAITVYTISDMIAAVRKQAKKYSRGFLIVDELDSGDVLTKKALSQLLNEYKLGDFEIPEGWGVIANSNRAKDKAGVTTSPSHVKNRVSQVEVQNTFDDWQIFAEKAGIHWMWIAAVETHTADIFRDEIPKSAAKEEGRYPSPRSVTNAARIHCVDVSMEDQVLPTTPLDRALVAGFVGEAMSGKLFTHFKIANELPKLNDILTKPTTAKVPAANNIAAHYTCAQMISAHATPKNMNAMWTYGQRLKPELLTATASSIIRRQPKVTMASDVFTDWLAENGELVLDTLGA